MADRAGLAGAKFGVADWARLAGLWHDLGKYHPSFQAMLRAVAAGEPKRLVDHSSAGAARVRNECSPVFGKLAPSP